MRSILLLSLIILAVACKPQPKVSAQNQTSTETIEKHDSKYSLAQWSYNKELFAGEMDNFDFIRRADSLGFDGVEFVSQFFQDKVEDFKFLDSLKLVLKETSTTPVMIMVDLAGDLGAPSSQKRNEALEAHKKWVLASKYIGCQFTRVNAHGGGSPNEALNACVATVRALTSFAKSQGITLLVENHGGHSSDADWILELLEEVGSENLRVLADFDNWCLERENGQLWGAPCVKWYDRYDGMDKILPYSSGISLKSFEFDEAGNETKTDFKKMFALLQKHNYQGWLGVEFEGHDMKTEEGVIQTKALSERVQMELRLGK